VSRVDLHEVVHETFVPWPDAQRYGKWILAAVAGLLVLAAIEFPIALLGALAVGLVAVLLIRFVYCYARARDARAQNGYGSQ
jgi:hypothetical protein